MELIVLIAVIIVGYAFLRMQGGEGVYIKVKIPPPGTSKRKSVGVMSWIVFALIVGALAFVTFGKGADKNRIFLSLLTITVVVSLGLTRYFAWKRKQ